MPVEGLLVDGYGSGKKAKVDDEGALTVVVHPHPPKDEEETAIPFRARFANSADVTNMNVDGSVTEQDFYIQANHRDIYINTLSIQIADGGSPNLQKFGDLSALTNGVEWKWTTSDLGEVVLHDGVKTNLEMLRLSMKSAGFGDQQNAFLADVSGGGTTKSYIPAIDISEQFGMPWGMRLRKNTEDKMIFTIRDDLTGLTTFDVIAYGVQF